MTRARTRCATAALTALLALGLAACGDDDDADTGSPTGVEETTTTAGEEETTTTAEEEAGGEASAEYCDALVEFNETVFSIEIDEESSEEEIVAAGEQLKPIFDEVEANAPDDLAATAEELGATVDGLLEGEEEAFNADATFETYLGLVSDSIGPCGYENTEVTAVDYAFEDVPATLPAGTSAITLTNASESGEEHEFVVFRKADGETRSAEELLNDPAAAEEGPGEFAGVSFAPPGTEAASLFSLEAGDYIAVCFIPLGGGEDGPPHFTAGMFAEFSVS